MFGDICDVTRVSKGFDIQNTLRIIVQQQKMLNPVAMSYIYTYIYMCVCVFFFGPIHVTFLWPDSCDWLCYALIWLFIKMAHIFLGFSHLDMTSLVDLEADKPCLFSI